MTERSPASPGSVFLQGETACFVLSDGTCLSARIRHHAACRLLRLSLLPEGTLRLSVAPALPAARLLPQLRAALPWLEKAWAARPLQVEAHSLPESITLPLPDRHMQIRMAGSLAQGRLQASHLHGQAMLREQGARRLLLLEEENSLLLYGDMTEALAARLLQDWCRKQAETCLPVLLCSLARQHGFVVDSVQIRDQRSRWGSCSRSRSRPNSGRISLNWRAVLLPRDDAAFLCLHELCHIRQMNHSPAFRAALASLAPDWPDRERRLSRFWQELPWWARPGS